MPGFVCPASKHGGVSELCEAGSSWKAVGDALAAREAQFESDVSTKSATKKYW